MKFEKRSSMPGSASELFEWHSRPGAFRRLTPPWQTVEVLREDEGLGVGKRVELKLSTPLGMRRWDAVHVDCEEGRGFVDEQESGPFKSWRHEHRFEDKGQGMCELLDRIELELPVGEIGSTYVRRQLEKSFAYRHWVTRRDLELRATLPSFRKLRIAITGGSGFLGTQLSALLSAQGHSVYVITRGKGGDGTIHWDPSKGEIDLDALEGLDAIVHLAGASLASGRWTEARKKLLWSSRVDATRFLVSALGKLKRPPEIFLSGSGIGFYGSDPEQAFDERSPVGDGFLAELCDAWESEGRRAEKLGARVCLLRTGVVLDPRGGALQQMLLPFRLGLGGPLGDGRQWFPWVSLEDWIGAVNFLLFAEGVSGPVNLVAPGLVRQQAFACSLGKELGRPAVLPAPKFALKFLLGEMADEALLSSIKAASTALQDIGYRFVDPELEGLLARVL